MSSFTSSNNSKSSYFFSKKTTGESIGKQTPNDSNVLLQSRINSMNSNPAMNPPLSPIQEYTPGTGSGAVHRGSGVAQRRRSSIRKKANPELLQLRNTIQVILVMNVCLH